MKTRLLMAVASLAFALGISCQAGAEPIQLRVAWAASPAQMTPVVFLNKSILKHEGKSYTVKFTRIPGSSLQVTAIGSGDLDLAALSYSAFASAILNAHLPVKAMMDLFQDGPAYSTTYGVLADSPIKSVKDLKGKVVGVPAFGGAIDVAARAMLIQNGLKPETDVQMLELPFAATEAALRAGKVAAAGFTSSFWNKATAKGGVRPLFYMRDAMGTSEMIFLAGKAEFLEKNKAALTDFVEDYLSGLRWFYDPKNREEALGYIAKFTKRPVSDFSAWALKGKDDYARALDGMINEAALQRNVDELHKLGLIKTKLDVSKHVDNSISQAAAARLK